MSELLGLTLVELCNRLHTRQASPVDLLEEVFRRDEATHEKLNAIVARRDREALLADAREAEARIARGEARPLEGIVFGVKDLEDAAGLPTTHGSLVFRDAVAERDSTQVARLRAAGAIVYGKTNAPEFGYTAVTKNLVYGVTRSPWNPERSPGGSSGGSAAVLAAGVLPLVTASDGGGSIRIPASFTGCFGHKPSYGRVPRGPFELWDHGMTAVYGPLTKTVLDAALVLDQVAGPSADDPSSLPPAARPYRDVARERHGGGLRVGFSPDLGYAVVQSDILAAVEEAAKVFEGLGHTLERVEGGPPELAGEWAILGAFELGARLAPWLPEHEAELTRSLMDGIRMARGISQEWWGQMARRRAELVAWSAELFGRYDLLVTPSVPFDPPPARGPFPDVTEGRPQRLAAVASFTIPFNLSWNPAATVRVGQSAAGLPIGMQIVGPQHRDDLVLSAACAFERERPWHPTWPAL